MPDDQPISLTSSVRAIPGIGPRKAAAFLELGIKAIGQLIAHLPARHEHLEAEGTIDQITPGALCTVRGEVTATRLVRRPGTKPRFEAVLCDHTGRIDLCWFNGTFLHGVITPGSRIRVHGKAEKFGPMLRMTNPKHDLLKPNAEEPVLRDEKLRPVYPASAELSSLEIERAIERILPQALALIEDHFTPEFRQAHQLPSLSEAYGMMHQPRHEAEVRAARRRLAYDEFMLLQLALGLKRSHTRRTTSSHALPWTTTIDQRIRARFPFTLTPAQDRVVHEIADDLRRPEPANRLVQGDVGSGKTVVALYGLLMAVAAGKQGAIMAPTEILAEQHFASINNMLIGSEVRVELLTGTFTPSQRAAIQARLAAGEIDIIVGTHALITDAVRFKDLAVAVIDEQHRFGVHQRLALRSKGADGQTTPHIIVMTATPIPRTMAMTVFGDLDLSTIDQLPPGRKKIITRVVNTDKEAEVYAYVRKRLDEGEQAYIVAPAIESEEGLFDEHNVIDATKPVTIAEVVAKLETGPLAGKRLAMMHGRMDRDEREAIMQSFRAGRIVALVATTVIEVGVDVPNATVMVIEDAERFGLATLHQLRGRVGRGSKGGLCVLISRAWSEQSVAAGERLAVMAQSADGFVIAQRDIEIRGFGDVIGVRQSGIPPFKVADLTRDLDLLTLARRDAENWIEKSPLLDQPVEKLLRNRLLKAHGQWLGLADVG